ncbi:helix-turn-helix domain-containing protein [Sinomonas sp.]|uniref:helix-turn-helix domain-containing protein n=1 Tax=Sinomonas sp. TaxID=1914986 RepID=UPI003FA68B20
MEDWALIRRLHLAEGMPKPRIARDLGISRTTVLKALASGGRRSSACRIGPVLRVRRVRAQGSCASRRRWRPAPRDRRPARSRPAGSPVPRGSLRRVRCPWRTGAPHSPMGTGSDQSNQASVGAQRSRGAVGRSK